MNTATEIIPHSATPARASLQAVAIERVRTLDPAYFALVMATGIVAIAVHLTGMPFVGRILSWFNGVAFMVLVAMTLARAVFFPRLMFADLIDHQKGVGFFTLVAGTAVLWGLSYVLWPQRMCSSNHASA